jgi:hypothetical protein
MEGCGCTHCVCGEKVIYKVPENQNWIQIGEFPLHSGGTNILKFELDKFTQSDWEAIALLAARRYRFREVYGIPTGGCRLSDAMRKYATHNVNDPVAIVDDVWTTGGSMRAAKETYGDEDVMGIVAIARSPVDSWVDTFLNMTEGWDT